MLLDPNTPLERCQDVLARRGIEIGYVRPTPINYVAMMQMIYLAKKKIIPPQLQYEQKAILKLDG